MKINKYTRDDLIEKLIDDDMDITSQVDGQDYLYNILKSGFKGYDNYTDSELIEEFSERTDEMWKFIK